MADDETAIGRELRGIPMEQLIAAPLTASTKAQVQLGKAMVEFVSLLAYGKPDVALVTGDKSDSASDKAASALVLPMKLERPVVNETGQVSSNTVTVAPPLLGLVPIPALLIDSIDVDFSMEIKDHDGSVSGDDEKITNDDEVHGGFGMWGGSVKVHGEISAHRENTRSTDKTAKYDVRVRANQQSPTEGMSRLMDLLASTVEPIKIAKKS